MREYRFRVGGDGCDVISFQSGRVVARYHHAALAAVDAFNRNEFIKFIPQDTIHDVLNGCDGSEHSGPLDRLCTICQGITIASGYLFDAEYGFLK